MNAHSASCFALARAARALRNVFAAIVAVLLLRAAPIFAEGPPNLILPLVTAIALASAASDVPQRVATLDPGGRPLLSLLPKQIRIVDGYEYDFEDFVGLKPPKDIVGRDRIASYDLTSQPRRGWMAFVAYDEESRSPIAGRSEVLRLELKRKF